MMRIGFDYQTFTLQKYGGISRYFVRLAQELLWAGEHIKIFAPLYINDYLPSLPNEYVKGKQLKRYPNKTTRLFSLYNRLASQNSIHQWQPSIIHETYYARHGHSIKNCPTVITAYDMIHELFKHEFPRGDTTASIKKAAITRADHIICISENTKKDLIELLDIPSNKVSVVLLGFDRFVANEQAECLHYSLQPIFAKPYILYVGARGGYKNFAGFLKAVAASPSLKEDFDVLAFGGGDFSNEEMALITKLGFSKNQVKQVSGNDTVLGYCYKNAKAFVYPSMYEGFGIPPLEAMAHGCPVISSSTSSMPEVIAEAGEYFDPFRAEEILYAIESVVYSDSRIAELRVLGNERLKHFSWEKCAKQTSAIYKSLM